MAAVKEAFLLPRFGGLANLVALLVACSCASSRANPVEVITSENSDQILTGDWMVEFYAPWCPACKQFTSTWESFGKWIEDTENGMRVGKVDVTAESVLSGQFMVTQLPTIFHIHNGEVRPYSGKRTLAELQIYIDESEWQKREAIPWWRSPTAKHMRLLGVTYWLSHKGKELQTLLEEDYQMPTYAVFIVIAIATILIGLGLGGIVVCCIEICIRMSSQKQAPPPPRESHDKPSPTPPQEGSGVSESTDAPEKVAADVPQERPVKSPKSEEKNKTRKRKGKKPRQEE